MRIWKINVSQCVFPLFIVLLRVRMGLSVLSGGRKSFDLNDKKVVDMKAWKNAGIGELCVTEEELLQQLKKNPNDMKAREKLAAKYCGASSKLACNFEIPDLKEIIMVCDCKDKAETWDDIAKECRRFAGRKQSCTDDSQCITGAACKNEALKLRDYSRWEAAVLKNVSTPRPSGKGPAYGKVKLMDMNDARRRRIRILSRIVRSSYKEEIGECTCVRTELKLEFINKTDPCISRKRPPPLHLDDANSMTPSVFSLILLSFSVLSFLQ